MPRRAMKRADIDTNPPTKPKPVWGLAAQGKRKRELDDLGPIQVIERKDIITLRDLCATEGSRHVAVSIGVDETTLLRCMAGLADRCRPTSTQSLRDFLNKLNS